MSQMTGTSGGGMLTDKEIAEDILSTQKHMSNYFYAPAILECADDQVRSVFQQVHSDAQAEAKEVFNYLNMRGWYKVNQADNQSLNELRNTAEQSKQMIRSISQPGTGWTGTQASEGQSGYGPSSLGGATGQGFGANQGFSQHPGTGWTGTQASEGQSGYGPSSLSGTTGPGFGASQGFIPHPTTGWTGTQVGEGQSGYGPSSLSQATGQRFSYPQETYLPSWTRGVSAQQPQFGQMQQEGQTGMGPSLFAQGGYGGPVGQPFAQQTNLPSWTRGTGNLGAGQYGGHQAFIGSGPSGYGGHGMGTSGYYGVPQETHLPPWTRGVSAQQPQFGQMQQEGQTGMGPSVFAQSGYRGPVGQFGGQQVSYGSQGYGGGGYYGSPQMMNLPSWTRGTGNMITGQYGGSQEGQPGMGPSLYAQTGISGQYAYQGTPHQVGLPSWTQGAAGPESGFGQGSFLPRRES